MEFVVSFFFSFLSCQFEKRIEKKSLIIAWVCVCVCLLVWKLQECRFFTLKRIWCEMWTINWKRKKNPSHTKKKENLLLCSSVRVINIKLCIHFLIITRKLSNTMQSKEKKSKCPSSDVSMWKKVPPLKFLIFHTHPLFSLSFSLSSGYKISIEFNNNKTPRE